MLPGNHAPHIAVPGTSTLPSWTIDAEYPAGTQVLYDGLPYQAKWANRGSSPQTQVSDPSNSPWKALYKIPGEPSDQATPGV